jgi:tungstate transport system ATP-binding protein
MTAPLLEFRNLQVRAGGRTLLDVASFRLQAGELLSLVGPNGSGKTTFLHTAAFLRVPDAGEVLFSGQATTMHNAADARRRISIVFQDPLLFSVNVLQNAAAGLRFHGVDKAEANRRALEFLHLFGVSHLANRKPRGLSGGEAARVALARAFATYPDLLLLDEPFSALDAGTRTALLPELRERLAERGAAAILVTHDIAEAFAFAPRLALLDGGNLIADGHVRDLTMRPPSARAAALLGAENVIPGRVTGCDGGLASVEISPGLKVQAACQQTHDAGASVQVTIPATMVRLLPEGAHVPDGWNALPARVTHVFAQPGWDQVTIKASDMTMQVREGWEPGKSRWSPGDALIAAFPPAAAWIIPDAAQGQVRAGCSAGTPLRR